MKMPNQLSVMVTHKVRTLPPWKPTKGEAPAGVGKKYRAARRQYRRSYRAWVRKNEYVTQTLYIPVANVEIVTTTPAEPRDGYWDTPRRIPTSFEATFSIKPESRGLFLGQEV